MPQITWTERFNIGIEVIDQQHCRIVEYINQLDDAHTRDDPRDEIAAVMTQLIDYTISHFTFEESMLEKANYPLLESHKKLHEEFILRVTQYQSRFEKGDDIAFALNSLLVIWLFNHIRRDDANYVKSVKAQHQKQSISVVKKKGFFSRLFK